MHALRCFTNYFWRMKIEDFPKSQYGDLWGYLVDCEERMALRIKKYIRKKLSYLRNAIFDKLSNRRTE